MVGLDPDRAGPMAYGLGLCGLGWPTQHSRGSHHDRGTGKYPPEDLLP
jgi:hypothetical protein